MDRARAAVLPLTVADRRPAAAIGRHARMELVFERRAHRTVLAGAYVEPPLRVGGCFDEGNGLHLIMASSSPGVFGGDCFEQAIHVGSGARVRITSQSSLQVHASAAHQAAAVRSTYIVENEGVLQCRWHPLIPFARSRLDQNIDIRLLGNARLSWSDAFTAGRSARGERWAFDRLGHQLAVQRGEASACGPREDSESSSAAARASSSLEPLRDAEASSNRGGDGVPAAVGQAGAPRAVKYDRLEYLERYTLAPVERALGDRWVAGHAISFGTILMSGWPMSAPAVETLHRSLASISGVRAAADLLDDRLMIVRLIAESGVGLHDARAAAEAASVQLVASQ